MDFARTELMKYGWKEGEGLGKNSTGIIKPVRPKLKFDTTGIGYNYGEEYSFNWWEHIYDEAAAKICVNLNEDGSQSSLKRNHQEPVQVFENKNKKSPSSTFNTSFIKGALLQDGFEKPFLKQENEKKTNFNSENIMNYRNTNLSKLRYPKTNKRNGKLARLRLHEEKFLLK